MFKHYSRKIISSEDQILKFSADLKKRMKAAGIKDYELNAKRLAYLNGAYKAPAKIIFDKKFPIIDGEEVVQLKENEVYSFKDIEAVEERLRKLDLGLKIEDIGSVSEGKLYVAYKKLLSLGARMGHLVGYGFLNGGSASSYIDEKKNTAGSLGELNKKLRKYYDEGCKAAHDLPKGVTPAYTNPDGSLGEHFMSLKLRAILIKALKNGKASKGEYPYQLFQMTSDATDAKIREHLLVYAKSDLLRDLIKETGIDITKILTRTQPLYATYNSDPETIFKAITKEVDKLKKDPGDIATVEKFIKTFKAIEPNFAALQGRGAVGKKYTIFEHAEGHTGKLLGMPGGHGDVFRVLKEVFEEMLRNGNRFAMLSNIDNMGATIDDAALAYFALSGKQAAFDFSEKTVADTKGGILGFVNKNLNCGDIGVAISTDRVDQLVEEGNPILFNAATGLFDLEYLVEHLDHIINNLPLRVSTQVKDKGVYQQAEQVTWEVMGMLDDPLVFAVEKNERFLAAKTLMEGLMTSGTELDPAIYPADLYEIAEYLSKGMREKLDNEYGMKLENGKWVPKTIQELLEE